MASVAPAVRALRVALLTSAAAALSACASTPQTADTPVGMPGGGEKFVFHTGRLNVVVLDQYGLPLTQARVDVTSSESSYPYRSSGLTDRLGMITFSGVPQVVNVAANHRNSFNAEDFALSPIGTSEMRMTVHTFETPEEPAPVPPGRTRAGPPGAGGYGR